MLRNLIKNQTIKETEKTILDWAKKEQGLHEAPTTQTGKIIMSKKVAYNFFCFHPRSFSVLPKNKKTLAHDFLEGRRVRGGGWFAFFCE